MASDKVVQTVDNKSIGSSLSQAVNDEGAFVNILAGMTEKQKSYVKALEEDANKYRIISRLIDYGVWELDLESDELHLSDEILALFSIEREKFVPTLSTFLKAIHPADCARVENVHKTALATRTGFDVEYRISLADGSIKLVHDRAEMLFNRKNQPIKLVGLIEEISDKRTVINVIDNQLELGNWGKNQINPRLFNLSNDLICVLGMDGYFKKVNPAFYEMLGWKKHELLNTPIKNFIHEEDHKNSDEVHEKLKKDEISIRHENRFRTKDEDYKWVSWSSHSLRKEEIVFSIGHDVTTSKQASEDLRKSEERLKRAQEVAMVGICEVDLESCKIWLSPEASDILGSEPGEQITNYKDIIENVHEEDKNTILALKDAFVEKGILKEFDFKFRRFDDDQARTIESTTHITHDSSGKPAKMLGTLHDVTERRQLEEQLTQAQKMEAIGRLAGGVAHDFNNMLTGIAGHADLALMKLDDESTVKQDIREIMKAAERAADLTKNLLAFSRKQIFEPKVIEVNEVVTKLQLMLDRIISEDIELSIELCDAPWLVKADVGQIEQVVMNLVVNARDAMPQGGSIKIETYNNFVDNDRCHACGKLMRGEFLVIKVSDNGSGMRKGDITSIFEPFFTTKSPDKGTGLGLSTVFGIVRQSEGYIQVDSELDKGSAFKIFLPRGQGLQAINRDVKIDESMIRGDERILVVEDEESVQEVVLRTLEEFGYTVELASSGKEGLEICWEKNCPYDLILTDIVMPQMSGREMMNQLLDIWPDKSVLFMSGHTRNLIDRHGILEPGIDFIPKPFRPIDLARRVREILDRKVVKN
jgi:PAS domain S-box-containing protein